VRSHIFKGGFGNRELQSKDSSSHRKDREKNDRQ
jgi:hypothetical protein